MDYAKVEQSAAAHRSASAGAPMNTPEVVQPTTPRTASRWGLRDAFGSLAGFLLISLGTGIALVGLGVDPVTAGIIGTPVGWLALGGWPLLATTRRGDGVRTDLDLHFRPVDLAYGIAAAGALFVVALFFIAIYVTVVGEDPSSTIGDMAEASTADWQVLLLVALALGAALIEELHFRGLWWNALRRRGVRPWLILLITSAVFSLTHLELTRAPLLFVIGLAIGFVRMRTGRLGPAIVAHLIINGAGSIGLLTLL